MSFRTRWGRVATVTFLVVILFPMTRLGCEFVEFRARTYATYSDAAADGAAAQGWLPAFVPASAVAIRLIHAVDTHAQWLAFDLPAGTADGITATMAPMTLAEARRSGVNRPWRAGPGWPVELSRIFPGRPRDREQLALFRSADGAFCLAIDRPESRIFAWRCGGG